MSRTRRKYEDWVDWSDDFDKKLERGQVPKPIRVSSADGQTYLYGEEVWGRSAKRFAKRYAAKARRRRSQQDLRAEFEAAAIDADIDTAVLR